MEGVKGWEYDITTNIACEMDISVCDDINGDSTPELIGIISPQNRTEEGTLNPEFGEVFLLNGKTGAVIWKNITNKPPIFIEQVFDFDDDGTRDFYLTYGNPTGNWNDDQSPTCYDHQFTNVFLSGKNGSILPFNSGNVTNEITSDILIADTNFTDDVEDFIIATYNTTQSGASHSNITSYFANGTLNRNITIPDNRIKNIYFMNYSSNQFIFGVSTQRAFLINTSDLNNYSLSWYTSSPFSDVIEDVKIIEDRDGDLKSELLVTLGDKMMILNNTDGNILNSSGFDTDYQFDDLVRIDDVTGDSIDDYIVISKYEVENERMRYLKLDVFSVNATEFTIIRNISLNRESLNIYYVSKEHFLDNRARLAVLFRDPSATNSQEQLELLYYDSLTRDFIIRGMVEKENMGVLPNFGTNEIGFHVYGDRIAVYSSLGPAGYWRLWLNHIEYIPYFIIVIICLILMITCPIIIIIKRKKFIEERSDLEVIKEHAKRFKIPILATIAVIVILTLLLLMISNMAGVFETTLMINTTQERVLLGLIGIFAVWFTMLPLIPAIYNKISPAIGIAFLKIRRYALKFSKRVKGDIHVLDLEKNQNLGLINVLRRSILPTIISVAIGINIYTFLAPDLGPISFGDDSNFMTFLYYFFFLGLLPMVVSFILMSLFIPSSWLLDDSGVVYYTKDTKDHIPPDVERLSSWFLNPIKGIAGFTAILSYFSLIIRLNILGSVGDEESAFIMVSILYLFFYGFPFMSGMGLSLFAIVYMEMNLPDNKLNLIKRMEKNKFNTSLKHIKFEATIPINKEKFKEF